MSKQYCEYCNGVTTDDLRGNCIACGAPRSRIQSSIPDLLTSHFRSFCIGVSSTASIPNMEFLLPNSSMSELNY